nr:hypothetical protein Iba_chr06cCG13620 [Ipomoea batatas]
MLLRSSSLEHQEDLNRATWTLILQATNTRRIIGAQTASKKRCASYHPSKSILRSQMRILEAFHEQASRQCVRIQSQPIGVRLAKEEISRARAMGNLQQYLLTSRLRVLDSPTMNFVDHRVKVFREPDYYTGGRTVALRLQVSPSLSHTLVALDARPDLLRSW